MGQVDSAWTHAKGGGTYGAVLEAGVREHVLRRPEQLDAGRLLVLERVVRHLVEDALRLRQACALRRDVNVVERVETNAELLEHLEGGIDTALRVRDRVAPIVPRPAQRLPAERVVAGPAELREAMR